MLRRTLAVAGGLLAAFHVWLLAGQAWNGQLADLTVLVRWAIAGALVWALFGLHRRRVSLLRGRQAVAVWLLAALLHAPAVAERVEAPGAPALPEVVATIAPLTLVGAAALGFALLLGLLRGLPRQVSGLTGCLRFPPPRLGPLSRRAVPDFAPRPPPVS